MKNFNHVHVSVGKLGRAVENHLRLRKIFAVLSISLLLVAASGIIALGAQLFSVKSETEVQGQVARLEIKFSSEMQEDGSVIVTIATRRKTFVATIAETGTVRVTAVDETGKPAKLEKADVVTLTLLYEEVYRNLDYNNLVEKYLGRLMAYLIDFYPVNYYFENGMDDPREEDG